MEQINDKVLINQLDSLLSYVPQLRRLSFGHLYGNRNNRPQMSSIRLNYLTHVSVKLCSVNFDGFELLVTNVFHQVQVLRITVCYIYDAKYLNANRWERLISMHMSYLCIFDFQHQYRLWYNIDNTESYETKMNKFNSLFSIK
jgi:hypothetical protein